MQGAASRAEAKATASLRCCLPTGRTLDDEIKRLRAEVAAAQGGRAHSPTPTTTTRPRPATTSSTCCCARPAGRSTSRDDREFPVSGMPNDEGEGFVDYVLWGDDGKPLGVVEAKRTRKRRARRASSRPSSTPTAWRAQFGQRPVIFYTNGYEHWLWDDTRYPPRAGAGLPTRGRAGAADPAPHERGSRSASEAINGKIVERYYQTPRHPPHRARASSATASARRCW